ncbi:MAG: hypothetical protein U9O06_06300 [Euryarchaeota archaeon]|nr:hypothetical protein [Euryarchaeota archaeon]
MTESALDPTELSSLEYRLDSYERLLRSFGAAGYEFTPFDPAEPPAEGEILLRHDVDLSIDRALAMAERERALGIRSTYCFLLSAPAYDLTRPQNVRVLQRISKLGHEIALHFDTHTYWAADDEPSAESIAAKVTEELAVLGRLVGEEPSTASFHIPPSWVLDRAFEAFTNTYAPPFFSEIDYRSDSSQKWVAAEPFPDSLAETLQLLVHPGLWHADHRPMAEIVGDLRQQAHRQVDGYFDPLG